MARKIRATPDPSDANSSSFAEAVKEGLEFIDDPEWLGANSPLAAPYFLGRLLDGATHSRAARGALLAGLLRDCVQSVTDAEQRKLLTLYYFSTRYRNASNRAVAIARDSFSSKPAVLRRLKAATTAAAEALSAFVLPPLRTEWPAARHRAGRGDLLDAAWRTLAAHQPVAISGPSGFGKTSLGLVLAERWGRERVLWFTVRQGLTDHPDGLAFALAYFLRALGAELTWRQMVADHGHMTNATMLLALIRADMQQLHDQDIRPLLVIDELEMLDGDGKGHNQLRQMLSDLREYTPMMLIGQRILIDIVDPNNHFTLDGLTSLEMDALLGDLQAPDLSPADCERLRQAVKGSPALIRTVLALRRDGDNVDAILKVIGQSAGAEALLARAWERLESSLRATLSEIAVFDDFAPRDEWDAANATEVLDTLERQGLIEADTRGGVRVVPYFRDFVLGHLPERVRMRSHLAAASVYEQRGEYTLAARHYASAEKPEQALRIWVQHRHTERSRGRYAQAFAMFKSIDMNELDSDETRRTLAFVLGELGFAVGDPELIRDRLQKVTWPQTHPLTPVAYSLLGDANDLMNQVDQAEAAYDRGLEALYRAPAVAGVHLHQRLGMLIGYRKGDMNDARIHALSALHEAHTFAGNIEEQLGLLDSAAQHYDTALGAARMIPTASDGERKLAQCYSLLGRLAMKRSAGAPALEYLSQAMDISRRTGAVLHELDDYVTVCATHIMNRDFQTAADVAQEALALCDKRGVSQAYIRSALAINAGEALCQLGRYDEAIHFSNLALTTEEPACVPYAFTVIGMARLGQNNLSTAEENLRTAISAVDADVFALAAARRELGRVLAAAGRHIEARAEFRESIRIFTELGNSTEAAAVELLQDRLAAPSR